MSNCRVFIGHLSNRATETDVDRFFEGFGRIKEINLKSGYGFVEFEDSRDADDAVYELNNQTLCGQRVTVELAKGVRRDRSGYGGGGGGYEGGRPRGGGSYSSRDRDYGGGDYRGRDDYYSSKSRRYPPPSNTKYRVIVENLSSRCSWQDLKDYLREGGEVTYAEAHQKVKNEGIVDFATYSDMKSAIDKLDNTDLCGRKIRLIEERSTSLSRSRSRSPRRSRSRSRGYNRSYSRSRSPGY